MPKVVDTLEPPRNITEDLKPLLLYHFALRKIYEQAARVINGGIGFGDGIDSDNINGVWYSGVTPATPDTEFDVLHNLGRVPVGWLLVYEDAAASIYDSGTPWSSTEMFLKCNVASVAVKLFII